MTRQVRRGAPVAQLLPWATLLLTLVVTAWSLPIDDFFLSMASGRAILNGADLQRALPFSWLPVTTGAGNPQWAAQLAFGWDGLGWALAVNALLIGAGLLVTAGRSAGEPVSGAGLSVAMLLGVAVLSPHLLARAQSFSIALFPLALLLVERSGDRRLLPLAFGGLIAVWANLHGAFVIGLAAAGVHAAVRLTPGIAESRSRRWPLALAVIAGTLAAMLNPAGPGIFGYAVGQGVSEVVRSISVEWQPAWPTNPVTLLFWGFAGLVVVARATRPHAPLTASDLVATGTLVLAATSTRHIPWFVLATIPMLATDSSRLIRRSPALARALRDTGSRAEPARLVRIGLALAPLVVVAQFARPFLPATISRITPDAPVGSVETILAATDPGASARVLNEQVWGGYLVLAGDGRIVNAMDGRLEIRDEATWRRYFDLMDGGTDVADELAAAGVHWALLSPTRTLIGDLAAAGWLVRDRRDAWVLLHAPFASS